jgi:hypothetical protein
VPDRRSNRASSSALILCTVARSVGSGSTSRSLATSGCSQFPPHDRMKVTRADPLRPHDPATKTTGNPSGQKWFWLDACVASPIMDPDRGPRSLQYLPRLLRLCGSVSAACGSNPCCRANRIIGYVTHVTTYARPDATDVPGQLGWSLTTTIALVWTKYAISPCCARHPPFVTPVTDTDFGHRFLAGMAGGRAGYARPTVCPIS